MFNARFLCLVCIIVCTAALRLFPHPPNFAPMAAVALFGGAQFSRTSVAFGVPLVSIIASDLARGNGLHPIHFFVYGSFAITIALGRLLRHRQSPLLIAGATVSGSVTFFLLSNFGFWLLTDIYSSTIDGLLICYARAIPYFWDTLAADAFYTFVLFGGLFLAESVIRGTKSDVLCPATTGMPTTVTSDFTRAPF